MSVGYHGVHRNMDSTIFSEGGGGGKPLGGGYPLLNAFLFWKEKILKPKKTIKPHF